MPGRVATTWGMKRGSQFVLKPSGAETASTTGPWVPVGEAEVLELVADVTAVSGTTPTLLVFIEGSPDGGTTVITLGRIGLNGYIAGDIGTDPTNIAAAATRRALLASLQHVRYRSVIGGTTPSFTYSVVAQGNQ